MSYGNYVINERISNIQAAASIASSKISSLQVPPSPNELVVVDTIIVADQYPAPNATTTITPSIIDLADTVGLTTQVNSVGLSSNDGDLSNFLSASRLTFFNNATFANASYSVSGVYINDGTNSNSLTSTDWTGNIQTVNTSANLTHYLNFSDSASTGYGHPQKTVSLSCNPFTNTISATTFDGTATRLNLSATGSSTYNITFANISTGSAVIYTDSLNRVQFNTTTGILTAPTFSGSLTGNASSASSVSLTSDNTAGTYYLPFAKTIASNSTLFVDNVTGPLTYNPSTSTLTATTFVGALTGTSTSSSSITTVSDNTSGTYYIPFSKTTSGLSTSLYLDDTTGPLTYNPSTSTMTASFFAGIANSSKTNILSVNIPSQNFTNVKQTLNYTQPISISSATVLANIDAPITNDQIYTFGEALPNRWVAGGSATVVAYSSDGISWTAGTIAAGWSEARAFCWNGSIWVAGGVASGGATTCLSYSTDGITWTNSSSTVFGAAGSGVCYSIAWNGVRFVAVGQGTVNTIAYSTDGITWTGAGNTIFSSNGWCVAWNGLRFVAGGNGTTNTLAYSSDGITWTGAGKTALTGNGVGVAWNGIRWVAVGTGTNSIAYSADGITWTAITLLTIFSSGGYTVSWNGVRFVAGGTGTNTLAYSSNGITWTGVGTSIFSTDCWGSYWNGSRWIAMGSGTNTIAWSNDGITWTGLGTTTFSTGGKGISFNNRRANTIKFTSASQVGTITQTANPLLLTNATNNKLDIVSDLYYNNGPTNMSVSISAFNT